MLNECHLSTRSIAQIGLSWNKIYREPEPLGFGLKFTYKLGGVNAIADAIRASTSLADIDLSTNVLTDRGNEMSAVEIIASAIGANSSLTKVPAF